MIDNFTYLLLALSSLRHILGDKLEDSPVQEQVRTENEVEKVISEWVAKFINIQNDKWEIKQKQTGAGSIVPGSFQQRKQTVGVRENTSAAINKIGTDLNKLQLNS